MNWRRNVHHTMENAAKIEREKIINSLFNVYFPAQSLIQYSNAKCSSQKVAKGHQKSKGCFRSVHEWVRRFESSGVLKRANVCLIRARVAKGVSRQLAAAGENTLCSLFEHPGTAFATPWPARGSLVAGKRGPAVPPASTSLVRLGHVRGKACEERAQERVCTRDRYWQNQPNSKNPQVLVFLS